jgi:GNAT superfamily N-acetyltransferase
VGIEVSTDDDRLDVDRIHAWLSTDAYWALGRTRDVVERSLAGSLNFGAYDGEQQVAFARVITDGATFAWLCDVYVAPDRRGAGVGTTLLEAVTAHLAGLRLTRVVLATADAPGVSERFGFAPLAHPERWMAREGPG